MALNLLLFLGFIAGASGAHLRYISSQANSTAPRHLLKQVPPASTFQSWYQGHTAGRGVWKWSNSLAAYDRHLAKYIGTPVRLVEVGVQSGGSAQMWHEVFGPSSFVHGIDICSTTTNFADATTSITIGDQSDVQMWNSFYSTSGNVDVLVDDASHISHMMVTTLQESFWRLQPGGVLAIEDCYGGPERTADFLVPAASILAHEHTQGRLASVHFYKLLLMAERQQAANPWNRHTWISATPLAVVTDMAQLWNTVNQHQDGQIILRNPAWGSFLGKDQLTAFLQSFEGLNGGSLSFVPLGCDKTGTAPCQATLQNDPTVAHITGVHIFQDQLVVEVSSTPQTPVAIRMGTSWLSTCH